jgi:hypothetical protein
LSEKTMATVQIAKNNDTNIFSNEESQIDARSNSTVNMLRKATRRTPSRTRDFVNVMRVGNKINKIYGMSQPFLGGRTRHKKLNSNQV